MARVTVNDCLDSINNHFELILVAAVRAKEILSGKAPNIPRKGSTAAVIALREISEGAIDFKSIQKNFSTIFNDEDINSNSSQKSTSSLDLDDNSTNPSDSLLIIEEAEGDKLLSSD